MNRRARFTFSMLPIILCTSIMSPLIHLLSKQNHGNLFNLPSHENPATLTTVPAVHPQTPHSTTPLGGRKTKPQGRYMHMYVYVITYPQHIPSLHHFGCPFSRAFSIQWAFGLVFRDSCTPRRNCHPTPAEAHALLPGCVGLIEILSPKLPCPALSPRDELGSSLVLPAPRSSDLATDLSGPFLFPRIFPSS